MANIKFEIEGKIYDFAPESFAIDNEGNIILKSKPSAKKRNPFERVGDGKSFYGIDSYGEVVNAIEGVGCSAPDLFEVANYCTDKYLLRRRALYEKLERCLWRFSMENGGSGDYYPVLHKASRCWNVACTPIYQRFGPSFKTQEACQRAIEEVIKPMLDGIAEEEIFCWKGV